MGHSITIHLYHNVSLVDSQILCFLGIIIYQFLQNSVEYCISNNCYGTLAEEKNNTDTEYPKYFMVTNMTFIGLFF